MENASKALLMAASVLIVIVIISAFVLMMSTLTDYQSQATKQEENEQTVEFNNQYMIYSGKHISGFDIASLCNKVIDYNDRKNAEGYTKMEIKITFTQDNLDDFKYDTTLNNQLINQTEYHADGNGTDGRYGIKDFIMDPSAEIENEYGTEYARRLASEISNIDSLIEDYDAGRKTQSEVTKEFNDAKYLNSQITNIGELRTIYSDAQKYYEFMYFKRAYYDCNKIEYDSRTGRIINMEFSCTGMG